MATETTEGPRKLSSFLWRTIRKSLTKVSGVSGTLIKWGIIAHCTLEYVGDFVICSGPSMEPNIRSHDILFTEHISPRTGNLSRGDIIVARSPTNPSTFICKRIVALPEDHLLQADGTLQHVPKGHIWIEGDNVDNSTDSRNYGPIPMGLVRGRAVVRVWPFVDATFLAPPKSDPVS
ncbi:Mitochondrial inner membrane protease subunit 1 [Orchesella cincta]|uniref:IMP2-like protein n=1 Tax=Orchesella cincta TaxID=48709 RepID=A0A1D2MWI1_ORCCI|nr:Mitochondrial inner membrane protease subunit 1 [Orchesella cincta]